MGPALLQPPKSSSGVTLGGPEGALPNPLLVDTWCEIGSDPPQAEKSFCIAIAGAFGGLAGLGLAVTAGVGSGVDQASLDPQASALEKAPKFEGFGSCGADAFFEVLSTGAATEERLNGEARSGAFAGAEALGAGGVETASLISKRPFEGFGAEGLEGAGAGLGAKLKSPKSLDSSGERIAGGFGVGFVTGAFVADFGPASKKPPPPSGEVTCGGATDERWLVLALKFANGSDLTCWTGFEGMEDCGFIVRPPNASSKPPKLEGF